ncbi:MAG: hypothetical protein ABIJ10_03840 [Candidatus Micrarchaeota archaeon]|nr:hypothetical protein [Candidatus Micrarchaeota archaeon]
MLRLSEIVLSSGEIKIMKNAPSSNVHVDVKISRMTQRDPTTVILEFSYLIEYQPMVARMRLTGAAYCSDSQDNIKKLVTEYSKSRKLPVSMVGNALNMINANVGINSLLILRPFKLVPPFMPPPIVPEAKDSTMPPPVITAKPIARSAPVTKSKSSKIGKIRPKKKR